MELHHSVKIVGLGGSLAERSTSLFALNIALDGAKEAGAEIELFDLRLMDFPMYRPKAKEIPYTVRQFIDAVITCQGMLWSSPLYHGSVSGAFKNALDWLNVLADHDPPYLTDRIVGLMSTAGGVQGIQAINVMEFSVRSLRAWAVPLVLSVPRAWESFDEAGRAKDPRLEEQLREIGREVRRAASQFAEQGSCDYSVPFLETGE